MKRRLKRIESSGCCRRRLAGDGDKSSTNYTLASPVLAFCPKLPSTQTVLRLSQLHPPGTPISKALVFLLSPAAVTQCYVLGKDLSSIWRSGPFKTACWESQLLCLLNKFKEIKTERFLHTITSL